MCQLNQILIVVTVITSVLLFVWFMAFDHPLLNAMLTAYRKQKQAKLRKKIMKAFGWKTSPYCGESRLLYVQDDGFTFRRLETLNRQFGEIQKEFDLLKRKKK